MRVLYIDVDCLRPDHLGCYGYPRPTSPNIDRVAARGLCFDNVYASDVPCLPSRAAMWSGRLGIHTGVVNHGGAQAEPFPEGAGRGFGSRVGRFGFMRGLRNLGFHTASVSSFAERHGAYFFHAGFHEVLNPGRRGLERAEEVADIAAQWLARNAREDRWFLHVNFWDPHAPYRSPETVAAVMADLPIPGWLTEDVRRAHWEGCGPHSAREATGFDDRPPPGVPWDYPRHPLVIDSPAAVRRLFDGYDAGVRHADQQIGRLLDVIAAAGVREDTAVVVTADHGENLGELNVYADHHTADQATSRVPLVLCWPGLTDKDPSRRRSALHYQVDVAATVLELAGGGVPADWDGVSFADSLRAGADQGREFLVLSQAAWTCQRAVRFRHHSSEYLCIRTYHDGYHGYPDTMLFDVQTDPHEQHDLARAEPGLVDRGQALLERWLAEAMVSASHPQDPMWVVLHEGGPKHVRGNLPRYLDRLRATGRERWAKHLAARHPRELG